MSEIITIDVKHSRCVTYTQEIRGKDDVILIYFYCLCFTQIFSFSLRFSRRNTPKSLLAAKFQKIHNLTMLGR